MTPYPTGNRDRLVYFVKAGELIKIGSSICLDRRLAQIQPWSPYKLQLLATVQGTQSVEFAIQTRFWAQWSHSEWFREDDDLLKFIADIKDGLFPPIPLGSCGPNRGSVATRIRNQIAWQKLHSLQPITPEIEARLA